MRNYRFKLGDKVKILDCPELHEWNAWKEVVGKVFTVTEDDLTTINKPNTHVYFDNNRYGINFSKKMYKLHNEDWDE